MFKTKTKLLILLFTIITLISTISFASDPTVTSTLPGDNTKTVENTEDEAVTTSEEETTESEQEIHEDDLYLFGEDVVMDKLVDGNVYIFANKVSVTGQINGNLFVCAQDFSLTGAYVRNSIFLCATNATFDGACTDLYAACSKLDVSYESYIARDSRITSRDLTFKGLNSRNMFVTSSKIDLGSEDQTASIYGNLDYTSSQELSLAEGTVTGEVTYTPKELTDAENTTNVISILLSVLSTLVYSAVVYFVIYKFTPNFKANISGYASKKLVFALLIGLASIIVVPIISILLLISPIASGLGVALLTVYALLISISFAIFTLFVTNLIAKKVTQIPNFALFMIVTLVLALLRMAPYISVVVSFVMGISGFGIIVMNLFKKSNNSKEEVIETISENNTTDSNKE